MTIMTTKTMTTDEDEDDDNDDDSVDDDTDFTQQPTLWTMETKTKQ